MCTCHMNKQRDQFVSFQWPLGKEVKRDKLSCSFVQFLLKSFSLILDHDYKLKLYL